MKIAGLQKTTLVDYPGKVAATVFTQGCNFRCPYCHNPELVLPHQFTPLLEIESFFSFLASRKGLLDAVCITGGEPTIQCGIIDFIRRVKDLGFLVKLDSNGTRPSVLKAIFDNTLIDYIAMDIKAPLERYGEVAGTTLTVIPQIEESIALIMQSGVAYEFRTTVVKPLLRLSDFVGIGQAIAGSPRYYIQNYQQSKTVAGDNLFPFSDTELADSKSIMEQYVTTVVIR